MKSSQVVCSARLLSQIQNYLEFGHRKLRLCSCLEMPSSCLNIHNTIHQLSHHYTPPPRAISWKLPPQKTRFSTSISNALASERIFDRNKTARLELWYTEHNWVQQWSCKNLCESENFHIFFHPRNYNSMTDVNNKMTASARSAFLSTKLGWASTSRPPTAQSVRRPGSGNITPVVRTPYLHSVQPVRPVSHRFEEVFRHFEHHPHLARPANIEASGVDKSIEFSRRGYNQKCTTTVVWTHWWATY